MEEEVEVSEVQVSRWCFLQEALPEAQAEVCGDKVFSETTKTLLHRYQPPQRGAGESARVSCSSSLTSSSASSSSSSLPNTMAQNLSVPLAFVALLHLANEKVSQSFKADQPAGFKSSLRFMAHQSSHWSSL